MVKMETIFTAADTLTPEFAAKLSECAARFESMVAVDCAGKQLQLDSLICILALELHRGVKLTVVAEGTDEQQAAEAVRKVLEGAE